MKPSKVREKDGIVFVFYRDHPPAHYRLEKGKNRRQQLEAIKHLEAQRFTQKPQQPSEAKDITEEYNNASTR